MSTFHELEMRYGIAGAYSLLQEIEKVAQIKDSQNYNYEERLQLALLAQDRINDAVNKD